jgi:membrane protein DedA with SNARE-associated domain/rhodanese-related sulfurtransferase
MDVLLSGLSQHGYTILMLVVFLEAIGLPSPAALALLIGGGVAASGALNPWLAAGGALGAMLAADTLMFLLGRYTGWWLLGMLCRLSLNPDSCILRSADSFYRRGRTLLLFAKFVPGINTMAPPLAGSMNMRLSQFLRLDLAGATLYIGSWFGVGFLFSGALEAITRGYHVFGKVAGWAVLAAIAAYVGFQVWTWRKSRSRKPVPRVRPDEAAGALSTDAAVIYDVRSHGYYDAKAMRIQGSRRLEPNGLHQADEELPADKQVYLYCTCIRDTTSSLVARTLLEKGVRCAVIEGGLRAWKKAGLPMEPVPIGEIVLLPVFES